MDATKLLTHRAVQICTISGRNRLPGRLLFALLALILATGCAEETGEPIQGPDTSDQIPPRAVFDLHLDSRTHESISLSWTAPGDDGDVGKAFRYDVRRDTKPITIQSWDRAAQINGEPPPFVAGRLQIFTINDSDVETRFYFALRTYDVVGNLSSLSNVIEVIELVSVDEIGPGQVTDLRATDVQSRSVELRWTATGDDGEVGTASGYLLRFHRSPLDAANFEDGTLLTQTPIPTEAGTEQVWSTDGLSSGTTYYFGLRAVDEASNKGPVSNIAKITTTAG